MTAFASSSQVYSCPLIILAVAVLGTFSPAARDGYSAQQQEKVEVDTNTILRNDATGAVRMLNRVTFNASVEQDLVDHWIVLFCVDWYEICQGIWNDYRNTAAHWEEVLAHSSKSWQSTAVRFGEVGCHTDKVLCNENNVEYYPTVQHFEGGKLVGTWEITQSMYDKGMKSMNTHLASWIGKELTATLAANNSQASNSTAAAQMANATVIGLREFGRHLSFQTMGEDPSVAVFGYFILVAAVVLFGWVLQTGLEIELKSLFTRQGKKGSWPEALLPQLPELPESRTIVRRSFEL